VITVDVVLTMHQNVIGNLAGVVLTLVV